MVRYETYNYLDYEEYKYLEDKTNSEMYPSSNKREFDTLLRKNIRWYLDSTIKDDEKRIELFDMFCLFFLIHLSYHFEQNLRLG